MIDFRSLDRETRTVALVGRFLQLWASLETSIGSAIGSALRLTKLQEYVLTRNSGFINKTYIIGALCSVAELDDAEEKDCRSLLQEIRRFGAKPDKKICRRSGGEPEFMEDAPHGRLDGIVVEIDRFWVVCAARAAEWLSGSEQGFDGFVAQDEERCHRPEAGQQRLVAAGVADPADDVFAAEFLQIISGVAGTVQ